MRRRLLHLSANLIFLIVYQPLLMAEPMRGHGMEPADIPFVASIARKRPDFVEDRAHFCSGSLIAPNLVLTAAHCLEGCKYKNVDVVIGVADLRKAKRKYDVKSWITFENWAIMKDPRMLRLEVDDIAIIKLSRRVTGVTAANITTLRSDDLYGKNATLVGWNVERDGRDARFFRKANVQILTTTQCQERFQLLTNRPSEVPEGNLCSAADPFTISTEGDSGGPLLDENNDILGITRGSCPENLYDCSEEFADQRRFNLHTDFIDEYRQFIDDIKSSSA